MTRSQLEHLIRACTQIADDEELIVIGSQAILGQYPEAPAALLVSVEADVYPKNHPERADLIDGSIGEGSPFAEEAVRHRLVAVETLTARLRTTPVSAELRPHVEQRMKRLATLS